MAREEIGKVGGFIALVTVLHHHDHPAGGGGAGGGERAEGSPWGTFTIAATMPIAVFMGLYLRYWRPGKVLEASCIGLRAGAGEHLRRPVGFAVAVTGAMASRSAASRSAYRSSSTDFCQALPVWLLLAPRDYLSTFVKLGVAAARGRHSVRARPTADAAVHRFIDGTGPIFAGKIFPFCFHHHRLRRDLRVSLADLLRHHAEDDRAVRWHAWPVGYGSMLLESFVAIMAMIAACVLQPGVYFAVNSPAGIVGQTPAAAVATISGWGFPVTAAEMAYLAHACRREDAVLSHRRRAVACRSAWRTFSPTAGGGQAVIGFWYHFAIMFEALFILTIIDAGTRVGRFMLQDARAHLQAARPDELDPAHVITSAVMVAAWGYFL